MFEQGFIRNPILSQYSTYKWVTYQRASLLHVTFFEVASGYPWQQLTKDKEKRFYRETKSGKSITTEDTT